MQLPAYRALADIEGLRTTDQAEIDAAGLERALVKTERDRILRPQRQDTCRRRHQQ